MSSSSLSRVASQQDSMNGSDDYQEHKIHKRHANAAAEHNASACATGTGTAPGSARKMRKQARKFIEGEKDSGLTQKKKKKVKKQDTRLFDALAKFECQKVLHR